jgi:hypothetical protein
MEICRIERPVLTERAAAHLAACHLAELPSREAKQT